MTQLEQYVKEYFGLGDAEIKKIANLFEDSEIERNTFYAKEGSYHVNLSFIKTGYIRVFKQTGDKEITQWISGPGEFITDLSALVFNSKVRWNIQAITDCELYTISSEAYSNIDKLAPAWINLEKMFVAKCFLTLEDRVHTFLSMTAEERYLQLYSYKKEIFNQVPLLYLASMLGMTPETLSRIRKNVIS